jgi:hypothetical protein
MWTRPIAVAETAVFIRQAGALWTDDERFEFVDFIARNPRGRRPDPGERWHSQGQVGAAASEAEYE